jgi:hypothetical protein
LCVSGLEGAGAVLDVDERTPATGPQEDGRLQLRLHKRESAASATTDDAARVAASVSVAARSDLGALPSDTQSTDHSPAVSCPTRPVTHVVRGYNHSWSLRRNAPTMARA